MKFPLLNWQSGLGKGNSQTTSELARSLLQTDSRRRVMAALLQRVCSMRNPVARGLRITVLLLIIFMIYSNLHSKRPYTTDLILKTSDLTDMTATPMNDSLHNMQSLPKHTMNCNIDIGRLREMRDIYGLDDRIEYFKRYIRFTRKPIERRSYTSLPQSFLSPSHTNENFQALDLSRSHDQEEKCNQPLDISVPNSPFPADVNLSDFIFAISTTYKRLTDSSIISDWTFWLTDSKGKTNGGKLLLRLLDASDPELLDIAQQLADVGIDAEVSAWDSRVEKEMAVRYLNLVPMLFTHTDSLSKKWLVLCDDDTFFTAMNSIIVRFRQFDHTRPLYIGTLSEDVTAMKIHGSQAFGGGGVFLSRPLAGIISSLQKACSTRKKIKQSNSGWGPQGDILLRQCIYDNTDVRLTHLHDLWQLDLIGDASGFYESGLKPYSIHHFKNGNKWHSAYPLNTTKIAHICGEDCPYQRFITADNFIISNGYSIAQYPDGIDFDLDQIERTFRPLFKEHGWNFDYTYGPQRPSLHKTGKKISWELRSSQNMEDGSVTQVYIRRGNDERWVTTRNAPMRALDGIIELVWIPE